MMSKQQDTCTQKKKKKKEPRHRPYIFDEKSNQNESYTKMQKPKL